ncbi:putative reverse transcriptase domain-containing protein [Tanacetum coccineum]
MVISVISVLSDSSEESVGTSTRRVILFGTIPTTILDTTPSVIPPSTHINTTLIPIVSHTIPPSPDCTPASPDYSPASDTEFDPSEDPSSDHIPPLPTTSPFLSSTGDSSDSDIPDTPPSPTYETSLDSSTDALFDSASSHSSSDHSLPTPSSGMRPSHHLCSLVPRIHHSSAAISDSLSRDSFSTSPSCKRSRSPAASVLLSSPILGALSYARADLLPSPKRIRSPESATDLEGCSEDSFEPYVPREDGLGVDFEDESSEPSRSRGTDLEEDVDVVRNKGIDARVVVEAIDQGEIKTGVRGPVEVRVDRVTHLVRFQDHTEEIPVHRVQAIKSVKRDQGYRIVAIGQQGADMLERIRELERDNMTMPNTRSRASRTREGINEQINRQMAGALGARNPAMNLKPLMRNGGNGNGGNRNGNGNGGGNGYNFGGFVPARECTYQDFLKCQPLSFNETKGFVRLTRWFDKVFHISNCLEKYQVKYAMCTLLNSALTWWNSHKRTIRIEAAYAMIWAKLMKLKTEVYFPRNEVQKMEIEFWNLAVKGNDLTAYTRRF